MKDGASGCLGSMQVLTNQTFLKEPESNITRDLGHRAVNTFHSLEKKNVVWPRGMLGGPDCSLGIPRDLLASQTEPVTTVAKNALQISRN